MVLDFIIISRKGYLMDNIVGQAQIQSQPQVQPVSMLQAQTASQQATAQPQATEQPQANVQSQASAQPQTVQVPNYSGVNIQIFNPTVATPGSTVSPANVNANTTATNPCYPTNYYTQNLAQPATLQPVQATQPQYNSGTKTETREVVELTDDYVKSLENYLNNQDKQVRLIGAKEVFARLQEDDSRKNDPALVALLNKMLQDPYQPIRFMAMGSFEARAAKGNDESISLLQKIQTQQANQNQSEDSLKASNALLKMVGTTTTKEFEVKNKPTSSKQKTVTQDA